MSVRLSQDEAWEVLEQSHTGILTTLKADGAPVTLPVWFVVVDRTIGMMAPSRTRKVSRIRRDPRASFLVESGQRWAELRAVHLSGLVEELGDGPLRDRIDALLDQKYAAFRTARSAMPSATQDHYANRSFLRFVPDPRMLTWDNRRIAPPQVPMNELVVEDAGGARTITFNRPSVKNALTLGMRQEFCRVIDAADRDPSVRAIIITGTDPVFTAGVDFKERDPSFDPRQRQFTVNPGRALRAIQTPSVCAVNGACISGGLEIALSATFAVASERARFADTHARLDVVPGLGAHRTAAPGGGAAPGPGDVADRELCRRDGGAADRPGQPCAAPRPATYLYQGTGPAVHRVGCRAGCARPLRSGSRPEPQRCARPRNGPRRRTAARSTPMRSPLAAAPPLPASGRTARPPVGDNVTTSSSSHDLEPVPVPWGILLEPVDDLERQPGLGRGRSPRGPWAGW